MRLGGRVARWAGTRAAVTAAGRAVRLRGLCVLREQQQVGRQGEEKLTMGKGPRDGVGWGWVCR